MLRAALWGALLALTSACSSSVYVDATVIGTGFGASELASVRAVRLSLDPDAGDPLRDRIVADRALETLAQRGIHRDEHAEVELIVHGYVVESEHWVPPETRVTQSYQPIVTRQYCGNGRWITNSRPYWTQEVLHFPGHTIREYSHRAELSFRRTDGRVLWMGELRADGRTADFAGVMKACIPLLLGEYPSMSGLPSERRVELAATESDA